MTAWRSAVSFGGTLIRPGSIGDCSGRSAGCSPSSPTAPGRRRKRPAASLTGDPCSGQHYRVLAPLRVCPKCHTEYDPPSVRCALDGSMLLDSGDAMRGATPAMGGVGDPDADER